VSDPWPLTLLALVLAPWWWPLAAALLADLRSAASDGSSTPLASARARVRLAPTLAPEGRVPVNRLLAFQGIERRVAARRRWEAGFGRRGL
jgi:hypothetical protein